MTPLPYRIGLVGLCEVGQVLAEDFGRLGSVQRYAWDRLFPFPGSAPQRALARLGHVKALASMGAAVGNRSIVVCAVTAGECQAAAAEAARDLSPGTYYLDLNSVSPQTKVQAARVVEAVGGRYIEAAVMAPIGPKRSGSAIWLGGPHARGFLLVAQSLGFSGAAVCSESIGEASAAKMCRSIIVKGMEALLAESLLTARRHGVEDAVLASLSNLFPVWDWPQLARYMISRSLQHGRRRAEEMKEVARTVTEADLEPWMSRACADRQQWAGERAAGVRQDTLLSMLDQVLARATPAKRS